jgi:hypothetical protein
MSATNTSNVRLYWKNVTADVVGKKHGLTANVLDRLAGRATKAIAQVNEEREAGKTPYRDLPYARGHVRSV